jgi:pimeloyl-ACP methyl ester carboxylesterase
LIESAIAHGIINPENPDSGKFSAVDAFGFSMGGLTSRAYACSSGHVRDLVTVGTPHVGALQSLVKNIERYADPVFALLFFPQDVRTRDLVTTWSPGTADLLPDEPSSPNPTLATMNALPCYGPSHEIQLIGGTDEKSLRSFFPDFDGATAQDVIDAAETDTWVAGVLATVREVGAALLDLLDVLGLGNLFSLGSLGVGEHPNDGIVPLRSAFARTRGGSTVSALAGRVHGTEDENFNHLDLGKPGQLLSEFTRESIFPALTDWKVATILEFEQPTLPTATEAGEAEVKLQIGYSLRRGDIESIAIVWYGKDSNDEWHILGGADDD